MDQSRPHRPRVSRETRLLLTTAFLAVAALWVLARVRFPDQPAPPNPVQPLLTQLAERPRFDDLARDVAQLRPRIEPLLVTYDVAARSEGGAWAQTGGARVALRVRDDVAAFLLETRNGTSASDLRQHVAGLDAASGLAIVHVPGPPAPPPVAWRPTDTREPHYLIATDITTPSLSMRPVFVGSLEPITSPVWRDRIWLVPEHTEITPGSFVFTSDGLLAGLAVEHEARRAIVPGEVLLAEVDRLLVPTVSPPGYLGTAVQALTPAVARATGAVSGVVVAWVDPRGPAAAALRAGDVIEAADGEDVPTTLHWETRVARLAASDTVAVRLRRGGEVLDVSLTAVREPQVTATGALGLALRAVATGGSEIVRVEPGSVAEAAGLAAGDVITRIGNIDAPLPAAIRTAFARTLNGEAVLVTFTRAGTHRVTALEKW